MSLDREVVAKPIPCQFGHALQRARLLKQVSRAGDDHQLGLITLLEKPQSAFV